MGDGTGGRSDGLAAEAKGADAHRFALDEGEDEHPVVLLVAIGGELIGRTGEGFEEGGDLIYVADGDDRASAGTFAQLGGEFGEGAALDDDGFLLEGGGEGFGGLAGAQGFADDDLADVGFGDGAAEGGGAFLAELGDGIVFDAAGAFGVANEEQRGGAVEGRLLGKGGGGEEKEEAATQEHSLRIASRP